MTMTPDNEGARALALATSAFHRAEDAERKSREALEGFRSVYEALGDMRREVGSVRGGQEEVTKRIASLERLVREGFRQLSLATLNAQRSAQESGHDLETLETKLNDEKLAEARAKYASLRARADKRRTWILGIVATVAATLIGALCAKYLGLK